MEADDQDDPGFFRRYRVAIIVGAVLVLCAGAYFAFGGKSETKKKPKSNVVSIMPALPPPPPPPPTPAPTPPPQEAPPPDNPKQPEFQAEDQPESPKEAPQAETPDEAPAPLGTNLQGNGPDGFGLTGRGGGGMIGGTGKGGKGGGSKYGWYAGQVQARIVDALQKHRRTRSAALSLKVRIWADASGRVTRATLEGSSGDAAVDQALVSEILTGLQLQEPPPEDMPMPIVMRITAKRPN